MIYARQPTDSKTQELKRMICREAGRVSQRAHMVLLSVQRRGVPGVPITFDCDRKTVRVWIGRFNVKGPADLYDQPCGGRPRKEAQTVQNRLHHMIHGGPRQEGYPATFWTVAMLVLALTRKVGVRLSPASLRTVLHQLGLRWGRPRLGMPAKVDPEKASKLWAIVKAAFAAEPDAGFCMLTNPVYNCCR